DGDKDAAVERQHPREGGGKHEGEEHETDVENESLLGGHGKPFLEVVVGRTMPISYRRLKGLLTPSGHIRARARCVTGPAPVRVARFATDCQRAADQGLAGLRHAAGYRTFLG